ncbi:hypothetical protein QCA50_012317 [Cerrena zonata]|uniref:Uncharacterized protein n=1 Tax=Cerrena zonata TaxID=2478898 RepID=A0AAW0G5U1_9APHY
MSSPNSSEGSSQAKPKSILKNKSSAVTLVDSNSTNTTPTAVSTPGVSDSPTNTSHPHHGFSIAPPVPELPPSLTHLDHLTHNTHQHSHSNGTPPSPYSASFDPNVSNISLTSPALAQPTVPPRSNFRPSTSGSITHSRSSSLSVQSSTQVQEQWTQIMSSSLNTLAAQFTAASQALMAATPGGTISEAEAEEELGEDGPKEGGGPAALNLTVSNTVRSGQETLLVLKRLEAIEKTQSHLLSKIASLEGSTASQIKSRTVETKPKRTDAEKELDIEEVPMTPNEKEKEKEKRADSINVNQDLGSLLHNLVSRLEGIESRMEKMEGKVGDLSENVRLDQIRLYPRLLNSTVPLNKTPIYALPTANGKAPPNFPATKGEFEHLTKERYEHLLKAYNVPAKGDTNAKRQTLREFIGLTPPGK